MLWLRRLGNVSAAMEAVLLLVAFSPRYVGGQADLKITLGGSATDPKVTGDAVGATPAPFSGREGATITLSCPEALPCGAGHTITIRDSASGKTDALSRSTPSARAVTFTLAGDTRGNAADYTLEILYDGKTATPRLHLHGTAGGQPEQPAPAGGTTVAADLVNLIGTQCPDMTFPDNADFVVRPDGNVLKRPKSVLNEGDDVVVVVYGAELLVPRLRVKRESAIRVPQLTTIFGANVQIAGVSDLIRQALSRPSCVMAVYELGDFAPGAAVIDISALTDKGYVSTGKVEFNVATLYTGAFSFGAMYTTVASPNFGFVFNGKDTVVTETGTRDHRMQYVMQYTPFVWGARDLTLLRTDAALYPMVGLVLNDVPNNAFAGLSLVFGNRVSFSWGIHAARVAQLDPRSGLEVGSVYSVAMRGSTVPVVRHWTYKPFYSAAIDLQAASDFLHAVFGTLAGSTGGTAK